MDPKDSIIQLIVPNCAGDTERLQVHRGVLGKSSEFFRRAMKPEWTDRKEDSKTLDLPEDSANIVTDYIKWLYDGEIPIGSRAAHEATHDSSAGEAEKFLAQLARAYVFAERIMDVKYKNALFQAIYTAQNKFGLCMGNESVKIVYDGTPSGSPLRRLIAADVAHKAYDDLKEGGGWMEDLESYSREALIDALQATLRVRCKADAPYPSVGWYIEDEE
ncbi:uncharacterized protein J4E78_006342 [Alternaria triticimaculans]|uniref:uncharacterized protein n=1 Tax=Alternaria triticimaculans TaxID=297637 RepID=UPI0020C1C31C|nr:uncharacterized protein J4E78_006342 [Alternaria triticimaculans]KAI4657952.1 hypothetical protein J4E78_006342 [Alternaria triticimaculans]